MLGDNDMKKSRYKKRSERKRMKGTVQYYNERKGYGIIEGDDGTDVLIYKKDLDFRTLLCAGDEIEYEIKYSKRGPRAIRVHLCRDLQFPYQYGGVMYVENDTHSSQKSKQFLLGKKPENKTLGGSFDIMAR